MTKAWEHQTEILPKLLDNNFLLFWDAGTGKTLPLLTTCKHRGGRALYLGPPAIRTQVAREAQEFSLFAQKDIQVVTSGKDKIASQSKLVICSYDHLIDPKIWKQLFKLEWETLVLDEGHSLKNSAAKRTRAVYGARVDSPGALFRRANRVLVATGTPLVNDPSDLWPHVSRLLPHLLEQSDIRRKQEWIEKFCHIRKTPYGDKVVGGKNLDELKGLLKPHVSRLKKSDVLHDLPPLNVSTLWVPPTDLDLDGIPEEALAEVLRVIKNDEVDDLEGLAAPLATLRRRIGLAKIGHTGDMIINELEGGVEKVIVFYQHKDVGAGLVDQISSRTFLKNAVVQYSGGLSQQKRDAVVKAFCSDKNVRVLVAQIQAAGTGLNLQVAERVVIVEPAWTPALNEQAIARAYRAGQKKRVWTSLVCLEGSIDEQITRALVRKLKIIAGAIG
jgi:SWI/SNF-related matrix-associated actin-dependent regulator 1 of chromatin subfamily A